MAKKKENTKQRYRKGGPARLDMREGGRVALQGGGPRRRPSKAKVLPEFDPTVQPTQPKTKVKQPRRVVEGKGKAENVRTESGLQNQLQEQEAKIRQLQKQKLQQEARLPRGGPIVPPTPEEIARRKAIQAQPIPEGFVRNVKTGQLESMRQPVPGGDTLLQEQPTTPLATKALLGEPRGTLNPN